ncbi:Pre-mRNA-splicing factor cwf23 [Sphaceloma murrayae]|uniref:Pre-mRNA-splicing factor cwf23 n=1 Tax=Sphaceloma murrayae TaxID=2082308 RepID=A0A2K1QWC0_9PEZI|nr:Pre-mRNA-splicing factor cwf23 [Sphaceloma murrayae]
MPSDDLETHARSSQDYYALLEVAEGATESEIRKAYRRTALKYHPDKNAGDTAAVEKFHILQIAYDVLSDASAKAIYDSGRQARREKELRERAFSDRRRRMKEDLERRESGFKRMREEDDEEERLQAEIRRLQADGARRRYERMEMLRKKYEEEAAGSDEGGHKDIEMSNGAGVNGSGEVSEMDRAVKVRWSREGDGQDVGKDKLSKIFGQLGEIDMLVVLKDKAKSKKGTEGKDKRMIGNATVIFKSIASAHAAVENADKIVLPELPTLEAVSWANNEEPQAIKDLRSRSTGTSRPSTPTPTKNGNGSAASPQPSREDITKIRLRMAAQRRKQDAELGDGGGLRKVPSFASFKGLSTPQKAHNFPMSAANTPGAIASPSLDQARKDKIKEEERRRLEDEIRREEQTGMA